MFRTISISIVVLTSPLVALAAESSHSSPSPAWTTSSPVVGGTDAPAGKWPDAVAVLAPTAACTGTLIAPDVVLTAGHCIGVDPKVVIVDSIDYAKPGGEVIDVKKAVAYPSWQDHYDVGVLVLAHAASTPPRAIAAACTARDLAVGGKVEVVGFGLTTKSGTGDNSRLHQAMLAVTDATCTKAAGCAPAVAPGGEFAAGGHGTDACFGDSGGPIYLDGALIGVVSRGLDAAGDPCGGGGIYVRADADDVVAWIEKTTGRKIQRASCGAADGETDGDGDGSSMGDGGCSAGGAESGALVALMACFMLARRRPRTA
jgi:secreted trypsin-like serine protease